MKLFKVTVCSSRQRRTKRRRRGKVGKRAEARKEALRVKKGPFPHEKSRKLGVQTKKNMEKKRAQSPIKKLKTMKTWTPRSIKNQNTTPGVPNQGGEGVGSQRPRHRIGFRSHGKKTAKSWIAQHTAKTVGEADSTKGAEN